MDNNEETHSKKRTYVLVDKSTLENNVKNQNSCITTQANNKDNTTFDLAEPREGQESDVTHNVGQSQGLSHVMTERVTERQGRTSTQTRDDTLLQSGSTANSKQIAAEIKKQVSAAVNEMKHEILDALKSQKQTTKRHQDPQTAHPHEAKIDTSCQNAQNTKKLKNDALGL